MRKRKVIKIDDREIILHELRVCDIQELAGMGERLEEGAGPLAELVPPALKLCCDLPAEDLRQMAPSELKALWEAFREVNADFFALVSRSGLLAHLGGTIRERMARAFQASS